MTNLDRHIPLFALFDMKATCMGLTIHYKLESNSPDYDHAQELVQDLHRAASDLPIAKVGQIMEFAGGDPDNVDPAYRWLMVQANQILFREDQVAFVAPLHVIAFTTDPGPGCESANFGLCRYPATVEQKGQTIPTGLDHWHWQSFCKTQYASNPEDGGLENFLNCHLTLVRLLDRAKELNMLSEVNDESGFWEHRDIPKLVETIGQWNRQIAGFVGRFKDQFGGDFVAPITDYPNFEHLEADDQRE